MGGEAITLVDVVGLDEDSERGAEVGPEAPRFPLVLKLDGRSEAQVTQPDGCAVILAIDAHAVVVLAGSKVGYLQAGTPIGTPPPDEEAAQAGPIGGAQGYLWGACRSVALRSQLCANTISKDTAS